MLTMQCSADGRVTTISTRHLAPAPEINYDSSRDSLEYSTGPGHSDENVIAKEITAMPNQLNRTSQIADSPTQKLDQDFKNSDSSHSTPLCVRQSFSSRPFSLPLRLKPKLKI